MEKPIFISKSQKKLETNARKNTSNIPIVGSTQKLSNTVVNAAQLGSLIY